MLPNFQKPSLAKKPSFTRNIAAPQSNSDPHTPTIHSDGKVQPLRNDESKHAYIDYRNYKFDELEDLQSMAFKKYCGPTPESNWVIPGKLLVGAYPASKDDDESFYLLSSILKYGINKFVCLQQEYRSHGVTEHMWRNGHALRPYFDDVRVIMKDANKFDIIPEPGCSLASEETMTFVHFPIKDCGITDDDRVIELARNLVKSIAMGEIIYLHCWGGHGRTGTIVSIMLHLMYNLSAKDAMARCQRAHDMREYPVDVGSPQTQAQRDQVARVVKKLSSSNSSTIGNFLHSLISPQRTPHSVAGKLATLDEINADIKEIDKTLKDDSSNPNSTQSLDTNESDEMDLNTNCSFAAEAVVVENDSSSEESDNIDTIDNYDNFDDLLDQDEEQISRVSENSSANITQDNSASMASIDDHSLKETLPPLKVEVLPAVVKKVENKSSGRAVSPSPKNLQISTSKIKQKNTGSSVIASKFTPSGYNSGSPRPKDTAMETRKTVSKLSSISPGTRRRVAAAVTVESHDVKVTSNRVTSGRVASGSFRQKTPTKVRQGQEVSRDTRSQSPYTKV